MFFQCFVPGIHPWIWGCFALAKKARYSHGCGEALAKRVTFCLQDGVPTDVGAAVGLQTSQVISRRKKAVESNCGSSVIHRGIHVLITSSPNSTDLDTQALAAFRSDRAAAY